MFHSLRLISAAAMCLILSAALLPTRATADNVFSVATTGVQRVLVIPVEFPGPPADPCPDKTTNCPVDLTKFPLFGPPRHSAAEWESLLNNYATSYWQRTSYDQLDYQFTVLSNPASADGWWPAPHTLQQYARNDKGGNWSYQTNSPASYPIVPDVTQGVVQSLCSNPLLALIFCGSSGVLNQYSRLLVIVNYHGFGAQTIAAIGGGVYGLGINTGTSVGKMTVTASIANEDATDDGVTSMMHELGHQLGHLAHYGDCSKYLIYPVNSPAECLNIGWDIMGLSYSVAHESAYSKVSRGYIDASATTTLDILGGPFSQSLTLGPIELPPTQQRTNVLRLSLGDPSWPEYLGYYVECRLRINGEQGVPELTETLGLSAEGLLVTYVHEFSTTDLIYPAPAHHVARPADQPNRVAALAPGEVFSDPTLGLLVRFDGFIGNGDARTCGVSVANGQPLPPNLVGKIRFAGNVVLLGGSGKSGLGSVPSDIGLGTLLPSGATALGPFARDQLNMPVTPPWLGHGNLIAARIHNRSPVPVSDVQTQLTITQPAVLTNACHMGPALSATQALSDRRRLRIDPASSTQWSAMWQPTDANHASGDSVGIELAAKSSIDSIATASRFAFAAFPSHGNDAERRVRFVVAQSAACPGSSSLLIQTGPAPGGWSIHAEPQLITLAPGQTADVVLSVMPPAGAAAGEHAEIPVTVAEPMVIPDPRHPGPDAFSLLLTPNIHWMGIGAVTVLGRVTGGPGQLFLKTHDAHAGEDRDEAPRTISGTLVPALPDEPITLEYSGAGGRPIVHVVMTTAGGAFQDRIPDQHCDRGRDERDEGRGCEDLERWRGSLGVVQAHWGGDNSHDATDSAVVNLRTHSDDDQNDHTSRSGPSH
jgi:hypothetical protein